jgi:hypothetical protein
MPIKVYSKNNCMQCKFVKKWLLENELPFVEINVEDDLEAFNYIKDTLNFKSLPVVETEGFAPFSGFNQNALKSLKEFLRGE